MEPNDPHPGFEEAIKDLIAGGDKEPFTLRDYLIQHMPERVYPPGTLPAYSNYGAGLAGYIVQRVSGMPFDDYVEKNIFTPLAMTHSTFREPVPSTLQPLLSLGYPLGSGPAKPFEILSPEPAGSLTISATDMAHFMLAQLQGGQYNGASILNPSTTALMHSPQFAVDPALPHMCLGFYEETRNGHRIIGHAGDLQYFHSDLHLMQDQNLGFFVSYNSAGRGEISPRMALFQAFLDRYFPYTVPPANSQANAVHDAQFVAGQYIGSRRPVTNILSLFGLLGNLTVVPGKDGSITVKGFKSANQVPKSYLEIGPLLYREKNGQDLVAFTRDYNNRLTLSMDFPFMAYTRVYLADNKGWNFFLLGFVAAVCLATLIWWPLSIWVRRHYTYPLKLNNLERGLRRAIRIVVILDLAFLLAWVALLASFGGSPLLTASLDPALRLIQIVGWLGSVGTLLVLYAVIRLWRATGEWWVSRVGNVVIAVAAVCFSWFLLHWHLLHPSLRF